MKFTCFLFSLIFLWAAGNAAFAAACSRAPIGEPPCAAWTRADVAFSGKVLKVESAPKNEGFPEGSQKIRYQVLHNFKGADNPTLTVVNLNPSGSGVENVIKKGETWIVYAKNDIVSKSFTGFRALKIDPKESCDELETLKNIVAGKTSSAISGQITSATNALSETEAVEIAVEGGGKRLTARSDAGGAFHIPLTDGNYRVELKFPFRAALKWDENLLGTSLVEGMPTVFGYNVRLNDGDCHFGLFEVSNVKN